MDEMGGEELGGDNGDVGTEGRGRDEELGVVRENRDMGTEGQGRDEELGVVRERTDTLEQRDEVGMKNLAL
jgi:hypothetical protein